MSERYVTKRWYQLECGRSKWQFFPLRTVLIIAKAKINKWWQLIYKDHCLLSLVKDRYVDKTLKM